MPENILTTHFGKMALRPTDGNHVYVTTSSQEELLTINNVEFRLSVHFYLWPNGTWNIGEYSNDPNTTYSNFSSSFYMERAHIQWTKINGTPSDSARTKAITEVTACFRDWATKHPEVFREAAIQHLRESIAENVRDIEKAERVLADLKARRELLENQLEETQRV